MDANKIILLVIGMTLVTYIPRALPFLLIDKMRFSGKLEKFLKLIRDTEKATGVPAPAQVYELKDLPVLHHRICEKERMGEAVLAGFER